MELERHLIAAISLWILTLVPFPAFATGGSHGGGGVGVRCVTPTGGSQSFEMLDIYETRVRGVRLQNSPLSEAAAIQFVLRLLTNGSYFPNSVESISKMRGRTAEAVRHEFAGKSYYDGKRLLQKTEFVDSIPLSNDYGTYSIAPNCHLEQVAYFRDETLTMQISRPKWNELNWLNRIALAVHEGVYFSFRERGVEYLGVQSQPFNSSRARQFVGDWLSVKGITPQAASIPARGFFEFDGHDSKNNGTEVFLFPTSRGTAAIIETIATHTSPYQMKAGFPGLQISSLLDIVNGEGEWNADLQFIDEPFPPKFTMKIVKFRGEDARLILYREMPTGMSQVLEPQVLELYKARY